MKYLYSAIIILLIGLSSCSSQQLKKLDAVEFNDKINSTENAVIIDVRTSGEYAKGYITNAKNIDIKSPEFKNEINKLDKDGAYFIYCLSGSRSSSAASYMSENGFKNIYELKGGILNWNKSNLPLSTKLTSPSSNGIGQKELDIIINSAETVLIDYYASWCIPCKKMEPILGEISKKYSGKVRVERINVDENKQLASSLGIEEIPYIVIYKKGKLTWQHKGFTEQNELEENL